MLTFEQPNRNRNVSPNPNDSLWCAYYDIWSVVSEQYSTGQLVNWPPLMSGSSEMDIYIYTQCMPWPSNSSSFACSSFHSSFCQLHKIWKFDLTEIKIRLNKHSAYLWKVLTTQFNLSYVFGLPIRLSVQSLCAHLTPTHPHTHSHYPNNFSRRPFLLFTLQNFVKN